MVSLRLAPSAIAFLLQAAVVHSTSVRRRITDPAEDFNAGDDNSDSTPLYTQEDIDKIIAETQADNSLDNDGVYMLLIAVCAGILAAIFTIWAYCFAAASREERRQKQNLRKSSVTQETSPASETSEESICPDDASDDDLTMDEELHNDGAISYDSRRPISHVHVGFTGRNPPGRSNSEDESSIGQKSQGGDSVHSNNSIFSYMKGLRRAAHQLGGIQMMFHVNVKDARSQSQTSEEKESFSEEGGDSVDSFFQDIVVSESDASDDEADDDSSLGSYEDSEDPSLNTTVMPSCSAFSI